jgi:hypothetical protein
MKIRHSVGAVGDHTLRHTLIDSGYPLDPLVEGVNQSTPADVARTLLVLARQYESATHAEKKAIRAMVMRSKTHARFAAANRRLDEAKRREKQEALLWISTWVENPPLFAAWLNVRLGQPCVDPAGESSM